MRYDAPYLVRRYAPMIGRLMTARRVTVAYQAYTLEEALAWARNEADLVRRVNMPHVFRPAALWIERRGQPARVTR